jgi:hypothetical protein
MNDKKRRTFSLDADESATLMELCARHYKETGIRISESDMVGICIMTRYVVEIEYEAGRRD